MKQVIGEFNAQESVRIVAGSHISIAKPHNSENDLYKLVTRNILSSAETLATTGDLPPAPYHARLVVKADDDGYNAQWVEPEETDSFSLILPLTAEDMAELRWYLESYLQLPGAGDYVRAHGIEVKFESWGQNLSEAIFVNRAGRKIRDGLMKAANAHSSSLLNIGASDPSVLGQPWEMMRDETAPLTFQGVTIRRQLETSSKVNKFDMKPPSGCC